jgi:hypothetical protein
MSQQNNCGSCNWHDKILQEQTYCLVYDEWYDGKDYTCKHFLTYNSDLLRDDRSRRALALRERIDASKLQKQNRRLKIIIAVLTIILTGLVSRLLSLW